MKSLLVSATFFVLLGSSASAEEAHTPPVIDRQCFAQSASFSVSGTETIQVQASSADTIFFRQGETILPQRVFRHGEQKQISYVLDDISALEESSVPAYLNDGNHKTYISFDPYKKDTREILIDTQTLLKKNTFHFQVDWNRQEGTQVLFFVAKEKGKFIQVQNPENFDVRYIKLVFQKQYRRHPITAPVTVSEIRIFTQMENTYILNPLQTGEVIAFTGYKCELSKTFHLTQESIQKNAQAASFSVDVHTPVHVLRFRRNPFYSSDFDMDGVENDVDNCPFSKNTHQKDTDEDGVGDVCDFDVENKNPLARDSDADGIEDREDNCPYIFNPFQRDSNADRRGDQCSDDDSDGIVGYRDNCPLVSNRNQKDVNRNGIGDSCEFDADNDGVFDSIDNCRAFPNPLQKDDDRDGIGNLCDNCKEYNPSQTDKNQNTLGDVCEQKEEDQKKNDDDEDGILNRRDNCPLISNHDQKDTDADMIGDACDNCINLQNRNQEDRNKNSIGDFCEDIDADGIQGYLDNCPLHSNNDQADQDNDGIGNVCEDDDHDSLVAQEDNCPFDANKNQWDTDGDGIGDVCDEIDGRFLESNRGVIIGLIVFVTLVFGGAILFLVRKINKA